MQKPVSDLRFRIMHRNQILTGHWSQQCRHYSTFFSSVNKVGGGIGMPPHQKSGWHSVSFKMREGVEEMEGNHVFFHRLRNTINNYLVRIRDEARQIAV